ncbi:SKP1-like protein 9 isoform X2 [Salvia divinorum]|uniref:SKP1-like protein 9 isoform X2 n=1 Tax=Salvia divinorum TaxID=28513 RepID=A0ABD1GQK4_SALDI
MDDGEKLTSLMSSDGRIFQVEDTITGDVLAKIIDHCRCHIDHKFNLLGDEAISAWDRHLVNVDEKTLIDLLVASHFLGVKDLFTLIMVSVADMMKQKSVGSMDQLRNLLVFNCRLD